MPNRILRDWTDSEIIDSLDAHAERFFTRLIMKVDDFGRFVANPKILKSLLFPLKSDVRETDITRWLAACEKPGLIALYSVAKKEYLQINNFKQVLRQKIEKYPSSEKCDASAKQLLSECAASAPLNRIEKKQNLEVEGEFAQAHTPAQILLFKKFEEWVSKNAARVKQLKEPLTIDQFLKLREDVPQNVIIEVLTAMQNKADLLKKYVSANLTIRNWSKNQHTVKSEEPVKSNLSAAIKAIESGN